MLKKLLIGLFLLGMLCGAGSISASPFGVRVATSSEDGGPATASVTIDGPKGKAIVCGGNC
jgi:hypothetical protein